VIEKKEDLSLDSVVSEILKEEKRKLVFVDGWNNNLQDVIHDGDVYEKNPYNFIILAVYTGEVTLFTKLDAFQVFRR